MEFTMEDGQKVEITKSFGLSDDMENYFARHKARYFLSGLFSGPGWKVLDFPCGIGYGSQILSELGVVYEGREIDLPTLEYAKRAYKKYGNFSYGDLRKPDLPKNNYDLINCIEGIEHIEQQYQEKAVKSFFEALKPGGTLIISSPEATSGVTGPSSSNPWHLWEMTKTDFLKLLYTSFPEEEVEIVTRKYKSPKGVLYNHYFCVCHKPY
jgi:2-polyprenyl-3-methyl-5-hydroxy-6-metoxy-1,4-benzoquinol methylase